MTAFYGTFHKILLPKYFYIAQLIQLYEKNICIVFAACLQRTF